MLNILKNFKSDKSDETGAVTVDWVVLTAAIVGLGLAVMTSIGGGVTTPGTSISGNLGTRTLG